jgi:hypothetical protein
VRISLFLLLIISSLIKPPLYAMAEPDNDPQSRGKGIPTHRVIDNRPYPPRLNDNQRLFLSFYKLCISGKDQNLIETKVRSLFTQRCARNPETDEVRFESLMLSVKELVKKARTYNIPAIASITSIQSWLLDPNFAELETAPTSLENLRDKAKRNQLLKVLQNAWKIWSAT